MNTKRRNRLKYSNAPAATLLSRVKTSELYNIIGVNFAN